MKWPFRRRSGQSEFALPREREPDRNFARGGRSFYFFDFDDNIAFLTTPTYLFHRETGSELALTSAEFARAGGLLGLPGEFADYVVDHDPIKGSFRHFRDVAHPWWRKAWSGQAFETEIEAALGHGDLRWRGPSWSAFEHAVFNARPVALITARGHSPRTIARGIDVWVRGGQLARRPNYLGLYPVNHPEIKRGLNLDHETDVRRLKQRALRDAVERAFRRYGFNPHHRFGMSDDDPRNIEWIIAEMRELKREYPAVSFFIIQTTGDRAIKHEVFAEYVVDRCVSPQEQLTLFDE